MLDQLIALGRRCRLVPLLGNHEEMLLGALRLSLGAGCVADAADVVPAAHLRFLRGCRDYYETPGHLFAHANYLPDLPLGEQPARYLRWEYLDPSAARPHRSGKAAVVGHTTQTSGEILDLGFVRCIDTFCHGGGWLTALEVNTGQVWQASREGRLRQAGDMSG